MSFRTPTWMAAAAFAAGLAAPTPFQDPTPQPDSLEVRVQKLERELQQVKQKSASVEELEQKVAAVEEYLQRLGRAAEESGAALDYAVEKGFAWGMNPDAHEALVYGIHSLSEAARTKVPGVPPPEEVAPDPRRSRFQREK